MSKLKTAQRLFNKLVRVSNADKYGNVRCATCGKICHWKECDAGHFIPTTYGIFRFNRFNVHPQCKTCNRSKDGEYSKMRSYISNKYGERVVEMLETQKNCIANYSNAELDKLIKRLRTELRKYNLK